MSIKKYTDAGFDINELFIAGFQAGFADTMSTLNEMDSTVEISKLVAQPNILPSKNLENAELGPITKPIEGINYVLPERESWFSTFSVFVDVILLQEYLSKLNMHRNATPELSSGLLRRSELFLTLRGHSSHVLAGFFLLYAHKPLIEAVREAYYVDVYDSDENLADDTQRMSPQTFIKVAQNDAVKFQLRKFCEPFRCHAKPLWNAIRKAEEYIGVAEPVSANNEAERTAEPA